MDPLESSKDPSYVEVELTWKRYIDDIFVIWLRTLKELEDFHQYLNNSHKTIKFDTPQFDANTNSCNFLDLKVTLSEGKIITDLSKKIHLSLQLFYLAHPTLNIFLKILFLAWPFVF